MSEKRELKWTLAVLMVLSIIINSNASIIKNGTVSHKVIKGEPIIIKTEAQHYQNPTLGEYQLCTQSRDDCIEKCRSTDEDCIKTCPVCPVLIDRDVLVQGINDTFYRLPVTSSKVNHTNVIRLTNEIHNIIETSSGNITANSQNNINVYQNRSSRTGGKFGLGYTEEGSCCHLLSSKRCKRTVDGNVCSHPHQRTCGPHCVSKVVRAKRVVSCSETKPYKCTQETEYVPEYRRPGCRFIPNYPFISCKSTNSVSSLKERCSGCYNLPYARVLRGQVPQACLPCYKLTKGRQTPPPPYVTPTPYVPYHQSYQPYYGGFPMHQPYPSYYPYEHNFGDEWVILDEMMNDDDHDDEMLDEAGPMDRKCRNADGSIKKNCIVLTNENDFADEEYPEDHENKVSKEVEESSD